MVETIIILQICAYIILFAEILYIAFRPVSRMQLFLLLLTITTLVTLIGYHIEIASTAVEEAMAGVAVAYLGKPFALLLSVLIIAEYCDRPIAKKWILALSVFGCIFPTLIFTNSLHCLYYSYVEFDRAQPFSPLHLGHGPLYYLYLVYTVLCFLFSLRLIIGEYKNTKSEKERRALLLLFAMFASSIGGYIIFLTGITNGYDTTMAGAFLGSVFLFILFFRYRLFDTLSLAKELALMDAETGLLVFNHRNRPVYSNSVIEKLKKTGTSSEELGALSMGQTILERNSRVLEIVKAPIESRGQQLGTIIEVTDITERHNYSARLERDVETRTKEIRHIQRSVIMSFAGIVEARDNDTGEHIHRISRFVRIIAEELRRGGMFTDTLTDEYLTCLEDVAPLHDIGKISVPDSILLKPARLTPQEFDVIKTHTVQGQRIIEQCLRGVETELYVSMAEQVALYHHERWDGTGYPTGLAENEIPLSARITAVADVYDALRSQRCYKAAMSADEARATIVSESGTHFDPAVTDAFLRCIDKLEQ